MPDQLSEILHSSQPEQKKHVTLKQIAKAVRNLTLTAGFAFAYKTAETQTTPDLTFITKDDGNRVVVIHEVLDPSQLVTAMAANDQLDPAMMAQCQVGLVNANRLQIGPNKNFFPGATLNIPDDSCPLPTTLPKETFTASSPIPEPTRLRLATIE